MKERRGLIRSVESTRQALEGYGAVDRGAYGFTDYVCPGGKARHYTTNNRGTETVVLIAQAVREPCDSLDQAFAIIGDPAFSYRREGHEYGIGAASVFVEVVEGEPMVEVEADTDERALTLGVNLGVHTFIEGSLAAYFSKKAPQSMSEPLGPH